ncbi:isopentenyl-diphosphate Delta-isomerase 1 [Diachasmimorpha longicaudata]|uniref:isopentenyl-diphosphate Delta-isomerase 1 n=1 Tax=Diachasmimorpha longicaudata TaxID=58733 RepID=UPI0030B89B89
MLKFANGMKTVVRGLTSSAGRNATPKVAPLQEAAMDEMCILVDGFDKPLGNASKRHCHRISDGGIPLHRAFSVFLFDGQGNLLLQKRSASKITFPSYYTNTCCSHPLTDVPGESEEKDALGIRRAARRRLAYELGIPMNEIQPEDFFYVTRIHYQAMGPDDVWGEHEIDYVLFWKKDKVTLNPNPDEISEIKWISKDKIEEFVENCKSPLTPWFQLILKHKLPLWWDNLECLERVQDHQNIQRFV